MLKIYTKADMLPPEWEEITGENIYLKRSYLSFIERTEKEKLFYYAFYSGNKLDSCMVLFKNNRLNLKLFQNKKLYKKVNLVYIPVSISRPLFVIGQSTAVEVAETLKGIKGITLLMNAPKTLTVSGFTIGETLPRCVLNIRWKSFGEYLQNLRSGYRRAYNITLKKSENLSMSILEDNSQFDASLYSLYESVYNGSDTKLEKLSIDFFRESIFKTIVFRTLNNETAGFIQLLENGRELIFEFTGINYSLNEKYDTYKRMLLEIVRYAVDNKFLSVDFGQTADNIKLKLGCNHEKMNLLVRSTSIITNTYLKLFIKRLEHKHDNCVYHVFNGIKNQENVVEEN